MAKGFKNNQNIIAKKEGISKDEAGAILGAETRKAGPAARAKNPDLNKVPGGKYNPVKSSKSPYRD